MERNETPPPSHPKQPICNNPAYYELFATCEEKEVYQAFLLMQENIRNENRYKLLMEDLDLIQDENLLTK